MNTIPAQTTPTLTPRTVMMPVHEFKDLRQDHDVDASKLSQLHEMKRVYAYATAVADVRAEELTLFTSRLDDASKRLASDGRGVAVDQQLQLQQQLSFHDQVTQIESKRSVDEPHAIKSSFRRVVILTDALETMGYADNHHHKDCYDESHLVTDDAIDSMQPHSMEKRMATRRSDTEEQLIHAQQLQQQRLQELQLHVYQQQQVHQQQQQLQQFHQQQKQRLEQARQVQKCVQRAKELLALYPNQEQRIGKMLARDEVRKTRRQSTHPY